MRSLALLCVLAGSLLPSCAAPEPRYSAAFIERAPRSILVLPPLDESIETDGTYVTYAALTRPLLESGYYVFPPAVVDRLMRENGLPTPAEMHQAPLERLVDIFDPDAVLLVRITNWGTSYEVLQSVSRVGLEARLIDADTGALIWEDARLGQQGSSSGGGGIAGMLAGALVNQVVTDISDPCEAIARNTAKQLLGPGSSLPRGPYDPEYATTFAAAAAALDER